MTAAEDTTPSIVGGLAAPGQSIAWIRGNSAATVDRGATGPDALHRTTIDLTGPEGPARPHLDAGGAVDELPPAMGAAVGVTGDGGETGATRQALAFFAAIATVMTLTVVIASTSTAVVGRARRRGRG
jgi:hypothetical protein